VGGLAAQSSAIKERRTIGRGGAGKMNYFLRTTTIKLQCRLKGNAFLGGRGFSVRLLGSVEGGDVSLMVLLVMKLHDLT
jgi:hypothetical protein